jgi:membrane protease YdiL (CAAX protease family)
VLIVIVWGKGLPSIGLAPSKLVFGLKKGLLWSAGFGAAALLSIIVLSILHIDLLPMIQTHLPASQPELILFFLIGGMVGPVAEEVFFRGMIYGFFRRWGVIVALVLSTLLFVFSHPLHRGLPFTQVVGGVLFAMAYEVEGSLMVPITIHVLANTAIFTLSLLS